MAVSPFCATKESSFNAGPDGLFAPRSHIEIEVLLTFR